MVLNLPASALACDLEGGGYGRFSAFEAMGHRQAPTDGVQAEPLLTEATWKGAPPPQVDAPVQPDILQSALASTNQPVVKSAARPNSAKPVAIASRPEKP